MSAVIRAMRKNPDEPRAVQPGNPFRVLVSCIISLRTKEEVTGPASRRLFALARTPSGMARLKPAQVAKAIYPAGFYRTKARSIIDASKRLVREYGSRVPDTVEELVTFKGVGRKTANLVVADGHGKPAICVDTHVHRIMNRLGYVSTKNPDQTETALRNKLPKKFWQEVNSLMVGYGRTICAPISPKCSQCQPAIARQCPRVGVGKSR